jgi:hypothetical protein
VQAAAPIGLPSRCHLATTLQDRAGVLRACGTQPLWFGASFVLTKFHRQELTAYAKRVMLHCNNRGKTDTDVFRAFSNREVNFMADTTTQFANDAQDMTRSIYGALQGMAETHFNICQKLASIGTNQLNQVVELTHEQLQLISRVRDPREYAFAQAELVKTYGQRYVDSVKQAIDITAEAWREYGDRLESAANTAENKARSAAKRAA